MKFQNSVWYQLLSTERLGRKKSTTSIVTPQYRNVFETDYDRIVFSKAFRCLQEKTQVYSLPEKFVHNRLTHSLEVSCVARSLGRKTGLEIQKRQQDWEEPKELLSLLFSNVVSSAALAHDIGNPPFGHGGESVISSYFKSGRYSDYLKKELTEKEYLELCNFEGNAQGFRWLVKSKDLSLSAAILGAFTKYPCQVTEIDKQGKRKSRHKYGIFQSEQDYFTELITACGLKKLDNQTVARHPLAFLVEAADDICYNIIDLEDAYHVGILGLDDVIDLLRPLITSQFDKKKLDEIYFGYEKIAVLRALSVSALMSATAYTFMDYEDDILSGTFDRPLIDVIPIADEFEKIKIASYQKIYNHDAIKEKEKGQHEALAQVLDNCFDALIMNNQKNSKFVASHIVSQHIHPHCFSEEITLYERIRYLLDYICLLTDRQIFQMKTKLSV